MVVLLLHVLARFERDRVVSVENPPFSTLETAEMLRASMMLQWPAFVVASRFARIPRPRYYGDNTEALTAKSYAVLIAAVTAYWFLIAWWFDARLLARTRPPHSKPLRIIFIASSVLIVPLFCLLLGADIFADWHHGRGGPYGLTVWLAIASLM